MREHWKRILIGGVCLALAIAYYGVRAQGVVPSAAKLHQLAENLSVFEVQKKSSVCTARDGMPDLECTPGAIFPAIQKEDVCTPGYSASVRNVSEATKKKIYLAYGVTHHVRGEYEVDHFVSLELGGSNSEANLFPEAAEPRPGFHEKDEVENYLHAQVCSGDITLVEAQQLISKKWREVYELIHE